MSSGGNGSPQGEIVGGFKQSIEFGEMGRGGVSILLGGLALFWGMLLILFLVWLFAF